MFFYTFEIVFLIHRHAGCWSLGWTPGRVMHSAGPDRPGGQESANESGRAAPPNHEPGSQELLSRPPSSFLPMWPRTAPRSQTSILQSFSLNLHSPGRPPTAPCRIQLVYLLPLIDVTHQLYDDELLVMPPNQCTHIIHTTTDLHQWAHMVTVWRGI